MRIFDYSTQSSFRKKMCIPAFTDVELSYKVKLKKLKSFRLHYELGKRMFLKRCIDFLDRFICQSSRILFTI